MENNMVKNIRKGLSLVLLGMIFCFCNYSSAAKNGLAGYWKFDEGKGRTVKDYSGTGNNGSIFGCEWVEGISGKALFFNGKDSYVEIPDSPNLNITGELTLEAWIKLEHSPAGSGIQRIIRKGGYFLQFQKGMVLFFIQNAERQYGLSANMDWQPGIWYHITVTYDGATMKMYINGRLNKSKALTGKIITMKVPLGIGVFIDWNKKSGYFKGTIDEVKIYNCILSAKDVEKNWQKFNRASKFNNASKVSSEYPEASVVSSPKISCSSLIKKINLLDNSIKKAEIRKLDVSAQKISLATAQVFMKLISKYKRIRTNKGILSDFVLAETNKIVNAALIELEEIKKNPLPSVKIPTGRVEKIRIENGIFLRGNQPVFLSGFLSDNTSESKDLGANLCGSQISYLGNMQFHEGKPTAVAMFNPGTHDWEYSEVIINPDKRVHSLHLYSFLRRTHEGMAWFDDLYAGEYKGEKEKYVGPASAANLKSSNLIKCPGFENDGPWIWESRGYQMDREITHSGKQSIRCNVNLPGKTSGCKGEILVNQDKIGPIKISGWSRAKNVTGKKDAGYSLYIDYRYMSPNLGWNKFDDSYFRGILPSYRSAEQQGFFIASCLWEHRAPGWLAKVAPDINVTANNIWFRNNMDVDHPLSRKFKYNWCNYVASQLKDIPSQFCYSLMGEERCNASFKSTYTAKRYENWLKKKYANIANLNKAWDSSYRDFTQASEELACKVTPGGKVTNWLSYDLDNEKNISRHRGAYYDWHRFNQYRLTSWNQAMIDGIKKADPAALICCWPPAGGLITGPFGTYSRGGINWEDIITQCSVVGWDGAVIPWEAAEAKGGYIREQAQSAKYNLGWRTEIIYYDFAKSLAPEKPIFDPEWHTVTSFKHLCPIGTPADFLRTALWMEHLHGMGAHLAWYWQTTPGTAEFLGGFLTQPQLLNAWGRTMLELRRLIKYITLFPQLERKVRILYSEASSIQEGKAYGDKLSEIYESLYFLDYPVGFITEKMIREGKLKDCALLVIPNCRYVNEETVSAIRAYLAKGGKVAIQGREALLYDEYGKKRDIEDFLARNIYLHGNTPEEYAGQLDKLIDTAGARRTVRALDKAGKNVWGVELRTASHQGRRIVYLINQNKDNCEIMLKTGRKKARNLVNNQILNIEQPFILKPRMPLLLEIGGI